MKLRDPGHLMLRRAARAAVVQPITYAFVVEVLHQPISASYAAFCVFTLLVFADFGGPPRDRALAYLIAGGAGIPLVAIGSLLSGHVLFAVIFALAITFAITFAGVLRGYVAASSSVLLLPLMLAMTASPDLAQTGLRCLGWGIGVIAATIGALVLWPSYDLSAIRARMTDALLAAAQAVTGKWAVADSTVVAADANVEALHKANSSLREVYDGALLRPAAATPRDRSMMTAVSEMNRLVTLIKWPTEHDGAASDDLALSDQALASSVSQVLAESATALRDGTAPPSASVLDVARARHEKETERWATQQFAEGDSESVLPTLDASYRVRMAAWSAQSLAVDVAGATRHKSTGETTVVIGGRQTPLETPKTQGAMKQLRAQFTIHSPWFRNSIRSSIAVGIAVLLVLELGIDHGFWIVLGTLTALRFDAAGTRGRALSMLVGTIGGFIVSVGLVTVLGNDRLVLFALLPVTVFLAAYTPDAISFALGQGSFTVFGVTLFALAIPSRYQTAEYRLLDITLAVAVSLFVSVLLWPRGVATLVRKRLDSAMTGATAYFVWSYRRLTQGPATDDALVHARDVAGDEWRLTSETFDLAISQRNPGTSEVALWRTAINISEHLIYAGDIVAAHARINPADTGGNAESKAAFVEVAEDVKSRMLSVLRSDEPHSPSAADNVARLRSAVADCLRDWQNRTDPGVGGDVASLVWAQDWLIQAAWLTERMGTAVELSKQ